MTVQKLQACKNVMFYSPVTPVYNLFQVGSRKFFTTNCLSHHLTALCEHSVRHQCVSTVRTTTYGSALRRVLVVLRLPTAVALLGQFSIFITVKQLQTVFALTCTVVKMMRLRKTITGIFGLNWFKSFLVFYYSSCTQLLSVPVFSSLSLNHHLYADDRQLFLSFDSSVTPLHNALQHNPPG